MMPRMYAMPRFPYGQAYFPPNRAPVFGALGQDLPGLPPLPPLPELPAAPATSGRREGLFIVGGLAATTIGWWVGSGLLVLSGVAATGYGLWQFPYAAVAKRAVGLEGV